MKVGGGKVWYTAAELADMALPGLPKTKRKINERAAAEGWALATGKVGEPLARPRQARGGGLEYHIDVLPAAARTTLARLGVTVVADVAAEPESRATQMWRWFDGQSTKDKVEAERRLQIIALVEAQEQVRPHLVVLGNAAHSLHPIAGQGYNLSLRDTLALAEVLIDSEATLGDFATLQRYQQRQQLDQQVTVGFSDQVTRLFSNAQPLLTAGRNLGLLGLDLLPPAKRWFARQAMGMGTRNL